MFGSKKKKQSPPQPERTQPRKNPPRPAPAPTSAAPTTTAPEPKAAPEPKPAPARASAPSPSPAQIGQTVRIQGELTGNENLLVDGTVEGRIVLEDHSLTIGEHADVRGELWAKDVVVLGKVVGDVHGSERIQVAAGGSVEGNLQAPTVVLAEGSRFKGRVDMLSDVAPAPAAGSLKTTWEKPADSKSGSEFGSSPSEFKDTDEEWGSEKGAADGQFWEEEETKAGAESDDVAFAAAGDGNEALDDFDPTNP